MPVECARVGMMMWMWFLALVLELERKTWALDADNY